MKRQRSNLLDNPPAYGGPLWGAYQYERAKEANRGHNYRYYNEEWWKEMEKKRWQMWIIIHAGETELWTSSEIQAQEIVKGIREKGNYARIICGYHQTRQHTKFFTVIWKSK